jgi:integrase
MAARRRRGEDGISFEHRGPCRDPHRHRNCPGLWRGEITLGYTGDGKRTRRKVSGQTKAAVIDKLRDLHTQLDKGITPKAGYIHYTVRQAAQDWPAHGLDGRSPKTIKKNQNVLAPILTVIGARKLRELTAADVRKALAQMAAGYSTAAVTMGHLALKRAIRHAEANDLVSRNVATLADTPKGRDGRPSKSLTLDQAVAVITAARTLPVMELRPGLKDVRRPAELMHAYITLSLLTGIRAEEARALRWAHVDLDGDPAARPPVPPHVAVWRSVRAHSETKTERSRRTLGLPAAAVQALRAWSGSQAGERLAAGTAGRTPGWCSRTCGVPEFGHRSWPGLLCGSLVLVDETAEDGAPSGTLPGQIRDRVIGPRRAELAAAVGSPSVVVGRVLGQDRPQVPAAEDQHAVGDLGPGGEYEPFRITVRARAAGRDFHRFDTGVG